MVHQRIAAVFSTVTKRATRRNWSVQHRAGRSVHGTEKKREIFRATRCHQRSKLVHLKSSLFLWCMIQHVWKNCGIVTKTLAKRDSKWFTDPLFVSGRYSVHWGEGWGEYFTSGAFVIRRTAKRKNNRKLIMLPSVDAIKNNKKQAWLLYCQSRFYKWNRKNTKPTELPYI